MGETDDDMAGIFFLQNPHPAPSTPTLPTLLGLTTAVSKAGKLLFTDLTVARSGGPYRLRFARVAGFLDEGVTSTFNVVSGTASRLFLKRQPGVSAISGWILQPQPIIVLLDQGGNLATSPADTRSIHATLLQEGYQVFDTNCEPQQQPFCRPAPRWLGPALQTRAGVATFTSLKLHRVGQGYTIVFCDGPCANRKTIYTTTLPSASPASASSSISSLSSNAMATHALLPPPLRWEQSWPPLSVNVGSPYKLVLWRELGGCIALHPCMEQPVVLIQDRGGNTVTDLEETDVAAAIFEEDGSTSTVYSLAGSTATIIASSGDIPPPPSSLRDLVVSTKNGRGEFADILVNKATTGGYTLSIAFSASIYNTGCAGSAHGVPAADVNGGSDSHTNLAGNSETCSPVCTAVL